MSDHDKQANENFYDMRNREIRAHQQADELSQLKSQILAAEASEPEEKTYTVSLFNPWSSMLVTQWDGPPQNEVFEATPLAQELDLATAIKYAVAIAARGGYGPIVGISQGKRMIWATDAIYLSVPDLGLPDPQIFERLGGGHPGFEAYEFAASVGVTVDMGTAILSGKPVPEYDPLWILQAREKREKQERESREYYAKATQAIVTPDRYQVGDTFYGRKIRRLGKPYHDPDLGDCQEIFF